MIKPKPMNKVVVFGPKSYMKEVIEELYSLNAVHIEDYTKKAEDELFDIGEPLEHNESYAELLVKTRAIISNLKIARTSVTVKELDIEEIRNKLQKVNEDASVLLRRRNYYQTIANIYKKKDVERSLELLKVEDRDFSGYMHYAGYINAKEEELREKLNKVSKDYMLYTATYEGIAVMALFIDKKADKVLEDLEFSPIDNPLFKKHFDVGSKSAMKYVKMDAQAEVALKELAETENKITQLAKDNSTFLLQAEKRLVMATDKAEAPLRMATTKNTFLLKGYVPVENTKKLQSQLDKITDEKVMVKIDKPGKHEDVPVAFNHPKVVEPFQAFMDLYTLPKYREIDPTFFLFLTFPIFFGFMLGDVGYGLVTLALFLVLRSKMPSARNILNAFIIASISSIFFGFVFGEYFGYEEMPAAIGEPLVHSLSPGTVEFLHMTPHPEGGEAHAEEGVEEAATEEVHSTVTVKEETQEEVALQEEEPAEPAELVYPTPKLLSRGHQINDLLSLAVLFGIVHILIGYIIGFINVYNAHGLKHAIFEKVGWMLILPLIVWLLLYALNIITGFTANILGSIIPQSSLYIVAGMFGVGAILVILGEGVTGAIEVLFFSLMSNILSYGRLMAVGLASVSLAVVVNDLAGQMFRSGIVGIIAGILILVIGHAINIALGILSPFLHSLRLHYVEFFNKFFKGGGRRFKSFGYSE